mmetsp:Transcript_104580/g.293067  ORF Transcript_104580/g.293067 Transcript_104580/m.293067 type:complete len:185 (+) Transcript_104580:1-555(+)
MEVGSGPLPILKLLLRLGGAALRASAATLVEPAMREPSPEYLAKVQFNRTMLFVGTFGVAAEGVVPLRGVCAMGAEEFFDGAIATREYDTVILWNILEHAFNAFAILDGVLQVLRPGGLLIFQERSVRLDAADQYFHPVRLTPEFFSWFLRSHFAAEYDFMLAPDGAFEQRFSEGTRYFLGRKK